MKCLSSSLGSLLICSALAASAPVFAADDLPSAESLLEQSLAHSGGKTYAALKSAEITGTVDMQGHAITGPVSIYQAGAKSYTVIDLPGLGKIEEGFDGENAWERNALQGARIKEGDERAVAARERLNMLATWRDFYKSAQTMGSEDVNGKAAWKIELRPATGKPEVFYLDKSTFLLSRMTQSLSTALGEIAVDTLVSDYRTVDGIQTPFRLTQNAMGQSMEMKFTAVKYNTPIPDSRFEMPAEVKALLDKRKAQ